MTKSRKDGWAQLEIGHVNPLRHSCALCGRPLARSIWRETIEGDTLEFCEPAHAALYESYWLPTYGKTAATSLYQPLSSDPLP